ncbi:MAG: YraN family protein [Candidatus Eisenbacteria bacterium]|nr:YraN family protein [Candidatus Eisenbacteria bacterium]
MTESVHSGRIGEEIAALFLRLKGYQIIRRNLRTRRSELDIVACRGDCLAFVEVKLRGPGSISRPAECVDAKKRQRVTRGAMLFLQGYPANSCHTIRFDVIAITCTGERLIVDHIENAFGAEGPVGW